MKISEELKVQMQILASLIVAASVVRTIFLIKLSVNNYEEECACEF